MGVDTGNFIYAFQSTLPVWGATFRTFRNGEEIQEFQSTLPVWGATAS